MTRRDDGVAAPAEGARPHGAPPDDVPPDATAPDGRAPDHAGPGRVTALTTVRGAARSRWGRAALGVLSAAVTGAGVLGAVGGLAEVPVDLPTARAGDTVDVGPVRLTVLDQVVTDEVLRSRLEDEGAEAWLAVRVVVAADVDETVPYLPDLIEDPAELMPAGHRDLSSYPEQLLVRDGSEMPQTHPGLPEEVLLLWPLADRTSVPEALDLTVVGSEQYFSMLQRDWAWDEEEPVARVTVPRGDGVPAGLVEEEPTW